MPVAALTLTSHASASAVLLDTGHTVPGSGGSILFEALEDLDRVGRSLSGPQSVVELANDGAFGAGQSTLSVVSAGVTVAADQVGSLLPSLPFPQTGPYRLPHGDSEGALPPTWRQVNFAIDGRVPSQSGARICSRSGLPMSSNPFIVPKDCRTEHMTVRIDSVALQTYELRVSTNGSANVVQTVTFPANSGLYLNTAGLTGLCDASDRLRVKVHRVTGSQRSAYTRLTGTLYLTDREAT